MRRFKAVLLCAVLLVCAVGFSGCKKDPFEKICSISYTTDSQTTTLYSTSYVSIKSNSKVLISKEEFLTFSVGYKFEDKFWYSCDLDQNHNNAHTFKPGDFVAESESLEREPYYKSEVEKLEIHYLYIKIIDNRSFELKNYKGDLTRLSVDHYKVIYFN